MTTCTTKPDKGTDTIFHNSVILHELHSSPSPDASLGCLSSISSRCHDHIHFHRWKQLLFIDISKSCLSYSLNTKSSLSLYSTKPSTKHKSRPHFTIHENPVKEISVYPFWPTASQKMPDASDSPGDVQPHHQCYTFWVSRTQLGEAIYYFTAPILLDTERTITHFCCKTLLIQHHCALDFLYSIYYTYLHIVIIGLHSISCRLM